jgi:hypothetical protein
MFTFARCLFVDIPPFARSFTKVNYATRRALLCPFHPILWEGSYKGSQMQHGSTQSMHEKSEKRKEKKS